VTALPISETSSNKNETVLQKNDLARGELAGFQAYLTQFVKNYANQFRKMSQEILELKAKNRILTQQL
jgi:hypothetical protein